MAKTASPLRAMRSRASSAGGTAVPKRPIAYAGIAPAVSGDRLPGAAGFLNLIRLHHLARLLPDAYFST